MTQCQRGDREAFAGLVSQWEASLFYYLRRLAASEADTWDLMQETWMKVYRALPTLREARTFPAFLYTTARRAAVTKLRLRDEATRPDPQDNGAADCAFIAFDNAEAVHHALDRLPLPQREAVTLYFLEELSLEEIAGVLGVPLGTVKSRLHYGKQAIRNILSDGDGHVT